jgi:hypothetical protein
MAEVINPVNREIRIISSNSFTKTDSGFIQSYGRLPMKVKNFHYRTTSIVIPYMMEKRLTISKINKTQRLSFVAEAN